MEMKQTPAKKEALNTTAFIPGRIAEKEDSFLDRDQEKLDKFIHNSEWLLCQVRILREQATKREYPPTNSFLWVFPLVWREGISSLDLGENG